jgi:hypothetical protein
MRTTGAWRRRRLLLYLVAGIGMLLGAVVLAIVLATRGERHPRATPAQPPAPAHPPAPPAAPPPPSSAQAMIRDGALVVDGRPLFPIFSWGECTDGFKTSLAVGTNLYAANRCGGIEAQVGALGERALSATVAGETAPAGAPVVGAFYPDEPDAQGTTGAQLPDLRPSVGVRFLTLTNHFYSGAAPLAHGRGLYPGLIAKADMVGFDLYPLQSWCRPDRLVDVYLSQRELVALAQGKPTFQWIEAAGMTCPHDGPTAVTPETVRAESWLAVAGGARGLGFFPPAAWTGDVGEAIADVTQTIRSVEPVLLGRDVPATVDPEGPVRAGARARGGRIVVVVANASYDQQTAVVRVRGVGSRRLVQVGSGRLVEPSDGTFTEQLPPLGAKVYLTAGGS